MRFTFAVTGFGQTAPNGTTVKFNPPTSQDTMVKNGVSTNINTRHQCITAMKEYQSKSLEELRVEDYLSNRKGKQATTGFATPSASGSRSPSGQFLYLHCVDKMAIHVHIYDNYIIN